jgi:hypothetical protein
MTASQKCDRTMEQFQVPQIPPLGSVQTLKYAGESDRKQGKWHQGGTLKVSNKMEPPDLPAHKNSAQTGSGSGSQVQQVCLHPFAAKYSETDGTRTTNTADTARHRALTVPIKDPSPAP